MINQYLASQIKANFPFVPTTEQEKTLEKLSEFILSEEKRAVFLLCGYAGTGKTTLVGALVKSLVGLQRSTMLMAPTGRAAKVFSDYSSHAAYTIHKRIYRQKSILESGCFVLTENRHKNTLFIVDEASMIANTGMSGFGSGCLLDDLIEYVYSGVGCRLLLLGDTAQLPPVGETLSSALSPLFLEKYCLHVSHIELTQVMRQTEQSGILYNATQIRLLLSSAREGVAPPIRLKGFADVIRVSGEDLIEQIESSYGQVGIEETMILCRSNKRANIYNEGIRRRILQYEDELNRNDRLMVVKNNYYWREELGKSDASLLEKLDFVANGDMSQVVRFLGEEQMYGFRYAHVELSFPDYEDCRMVLHILLDTLHSESPSLTRAESEKLFTAAWNDYPEVKSKRKRAQIVRENPYFNALQVKYGYAVTCHKSQGGQWKRVFLDQGFMPADGLTSDYYRWLYTAFTRATETIYLVNWPQREQE